MPLKAVIWTAVSSQQQATEDKISLEEQERLCRDWCEKNGYYVTKHLSVPGHSRSETDIVKLLEDFRKEGVYAYDRLRTLWEARDCDVLVAYHPSRLGRSQTVYTYVVENTIRAGIDIYLIDGGWIKPAEAQFNIAIGGFMASNEIKRLVKGRHDGMRKKMPRGIPTAMPPMSHILVRDHRGKASHLEVNESVRRIFEDAAHLLLEGIAWKKLEFELNQRYFHLNPGTGERFSDGVLHHIFFSPVFWGNNAYGSRAGNKVRRGLWCFDNTIAPPPGVTIFYGTHPAMLTGDLGERVKAEIHRRSATVKGRARPYGTSIFSGLLVCGVCGRRMVYHVSRSTAKRKTRSTRYYYICPSQQFSWQKCGNKTHSQVKNLKLQIEPYIQLLIDGQTLDDVLRPPQNDAQEQAARLDADIAAKQDEIRALIRLQARNANNDNLVERYQEQIEATQAELEQMTAQRQQQESRSIRITDAQRQLAAELRCMESAAELWDLSDQEIQQRLHGLLGVWRFELRDGIITRLVVP